jgi:hypothetical protein
MRITEVPEEDLKCRMTVEYKNKKFILSDTEKLVRKTKQQ